MSRPEPKFHVGEEVLVLSEFDKPGVWESDVITHIQYFTNVLIQQTMKPAPSGMYYKFTDGAWAEESRLCKKHKPSDQSFDQLMQSLTKEKVE